MNSPIRFVSLGFGNILCLNKIFGAMMYRSAQSRRIVAKAKEDGRYVDWTSHRQLTSIVITDDGTVIGSSFAVSTLFRRFQDACESKFQEAIKDILKEEVEEEDED